MVRAISFAGCGFNGAYHIGASTALAKKLDYKNLKFTGASAGSIGSESQNIIQTKVGIF